jgi:hypothetical protein
LLEISELHRFACTAGGEQGAAVGQLAERDRRVAGERVTDLVAGGRVPQPHRLVHAGGEQAGTVGQLAERDRRHLVGVGERVTDRLAPGRIPYRAVSSQLPEASTVWPLGSWPNATASPGQ